MPSYFSRTHLVTMSISTYPEGRTPLLQSYHPLGSMCIVVKKHAEVGCPIPSMLIVCDSKKPSGGASDIGSPFCGNSASTSGLFCLMVAIRLHDMRQRGSVTEYMAGVLPPICAAVPPAGNRNDGDPARLCQLHLQFVLCLNVLQWDVCHRGCDVVMPFLHKD